MLQDKIARSNPIQNCDFFFPIKNNNENFYNNKIEILNTWNETCGTE